MLSEFNGLKDREGCFRLDIDITVTTDDTTSESDPPEESTWEEDKDEADTSVAEQELPPNNENRNRFRELQSSQNRFCRQHGLRFKEDTSSRTRKKTRPRKRPRSNTL